MTDPRTFVEEFNSAHENPPNRAKIILQEDGEQIYGIIIRFLELHHRFETSQYEEMQVVIRNLTSGSIVFTDGLNTLNRGIINLSVNFCNHRYNPAIITKALDYIVNKAIPRAKNEKTA